MKRFILCQILLPLWSMMQFPCLDSVSFWGIPFHILSTEFEVVWTPPRGCASGRVGFAGWKNGFGVFCSRIGAQLRTNDGYLLLHSDEAGQCLDLTFSGSSPGATKKGEHVDVTLFLDSAHGDEVHCSTTMLDRKKFRPERTHSPATHLPNSCNFCCHIFHGHTFHTFFFRKHCHPPITTQG